MIEELKPFNDYLNQAAVVISQHSLGCSITEPSELKIARKQYLFSLIEFLQSHLDDETFERLIYTDNLPWSKGGKTVYENLQMLCKSCNSGKNNCAPIDEDEAEED